MALHHASNVVRSSSGAAIHRSGCGACAVTRAAQAPGSATGRLPVPIDTDTTAAKTRRRTPEPTVLRYATIRAPVLQHSVPMRVSRRAVSAIWPSSGIDAIRGLTVSARVPLCVTNVLTLALLSTACSSETDSETPGPAFSSHLLRRPSGDGARLIHRGDRSSSTAAERQHSARRRCELRDQPVASLIGTWVADASLRGGLSAAWRRES